MMQNEFSNAERAEVLTAALPYIKKYSGKIVVVKYGGNAMVNEQLKQQVMEDIVLLWLIGVRPSPFQSNRRRALSNLCAFS